MKSTDAAVATTRLNLVRGDASILKSITLDIPAGAVVGLVGRNGAGKSSLLRCLAGVTELSSGTASLLGCRSSGLTDAVRERLGFVAQTPDLFGWMQADEMVASVGRAYPRWSHERAESPARRLDLRLARKVGELAGSDQQKLAVVLALAHDPDLLLLDEPVASLDSAERPRIHARAVRRRRRRGGARTHHRHVQPHPHRPRTRGLACRFYARRRDPAVRGLGHAARIVPAAAFRCARHPAGGRRPHQQPQRRPRGRHARGAPGADAGRALTLDELFVELNA
ncbi:ATP-binding cassette domain-containing protein [Massilia sp. TWR1-2-2]|uniref:ATP-binding cassette domain-containing protein n=1 Tax=Massilia sp. TWR1-2-2 TaxID=2804584 RepID=UPI003CE9363A